MCFTFALPTFILVLLKIEFVVAHHAFLTHWTKEKRTFVVVASQYTNVVLVHNIVGTTFAALVKSLTRGSVQAVRHVVHKCFFVKSFFHVVRQPLKVTHQKNVYAALWTMDSIMHAHAWDSDRTFYESFKSIGKIIPYCINKYQNCLDFLVDDRKQLSPNSRVKRNGLRNLTRDPVLWKGQILCVSWTMKLLGSN